MQQSEKTPEKILAVMIGIQGSGKSTFFRTHLEKNFIRVNLDTLKTRNREHLLVASCLAEGKSFAIDNTNPTREDRARYIPSARENGYRIIGYVMECDLSACIERNNRRVGKERIPEKGIAATLKRLEPPTFSEGFDELYFVRIVENGFSVEPFLQ